MINMNLKFFYLILFGLLLIFVATNTNAKTIVIKNEGPLSSFLNSLKMIFLVALIY